MAYIYKITNTLNGKMYVGKTTTSIQERFKRHCYDRDKRSCEKRPLYNAMNKYGIEAFTIELLEEISNSLASEREIHWIKVLNTYSDGYNATIGGDGTILYDYDLIIMDYNSGMLVNEITSKYGCDKDVVERALASVGIMRRLNRYAREAKSVAQIDTSNNTIIAVYDSLADAGRALGDESKKKHISKVANGERKTAYGYKWQFVNI